MNVNNRLQHYNYKPVNTAIDARALQKPLLSIVSDFFDVTEIWEKNKELRILLETNSIVIFWVPVQLKFAPIFNRELETNYNFRINLLPLQVTNYNDYETKIWQEYIAWINYISTKNINNRKIFKEYLILFFMTYHNNYIHNHYQKKLKPNLFRLNPFIKYWFECYDLISSLNLFNNIIILPNICDNALLEKVKKIKEKNDIYKI